MSESAIVDSTCLIAYEKVGCLELLPALFGPIHAPPAVEHEVGGSPSWLIIEAPTDVALVTALRMNIDDGEAEAIALAVERGWKIILDDLQARTVARRMGLKLIGAVGILVKAKRAGLLPEVRPVVRELSKSGFYLSDDLKEEVLRLAGE